MSSRRKILYGFCCVFTLFLSCVLLWVSHKQVTPIVMYHHVRHVDKPQSDVVSPDYLREHFGYLQKNNYYVMSLEKLVSHIKEGRKISRKAVVITFDDGYDNFYENAYPLIKEFGFPVTLFIASELMDTKGNLTWDQVKEMAKYGITIGSHSRHHRYLPDLSKEEQADEIIVSKQIIEGTIGFDVDYFSYPIGGFNDQIKQMVRSAGYKAACATNRGFDRSNHDVYELNRVRLGDRDNQGMILWMKFSGYYNLFREAKNPS